MIIRTLQVGPLQANCHILGCEETKKAAVIDPGGDTDKILLALAKDHLSLTAIINTHGHFDHVSGNPSLKKATGADLMIHEVIDLDLLEKAITKQLPPALAQGLMRHMREEHTTAEDVGRLAKAAGVKQLVLNHIIPGQDEPDSVYLDPIKKH